MTVLSGDDNKSGDSTDNRYAFKIFYDKDIDWIWIVDAQ